GPVRACALRCTGRADVVREVWTDGVRGIRTDVVHAPRADIVREITASARRPPEAFVPHSP
ncbi:hypothetical protein AB0B79_22450, partial [Streptomyces sp. NPDC039022]|uniref:hypothetical protein n=1 Tax=Streptomyces sp. NPDC039022 TaxID=3157091 RepID=UPI0033ED3176